MSDIDKAAACAIVLAKDRGCDEVLPDDLLLGCLYAISRFAIARLGCWSFDLVKFGLGCTYSPHPTSAKVTYSEAVVKIFDQAAMIARADGGDTVRLEHVLVAFADEESGLMGRLKREFQVESASWRAAVAELRLRGSDGAKQGVGQDYLTPEQAAEVLNIHVQTLRGYVRSGKLPALRLAGERAIRIRRTDLDRVLEPLTPEKE